MRAPFLSLEELNTSSAEELAATIASADDEHQRLETEDKIESQELAQLEEHIDNAQVAAGAIGETAVRLEATYPEGVPDEVVQTLEPVLEALKNVVGFKPGSMKVAVEGLNGKERTRVAVEGLTETAKKIWEAIKAAFMRLVNFVKDLFSRQGKKQEVLEKKIDAVLEAWQSEVFKDSGATAAGAPAQISYPFMVAKRDGSAPSYHEMESWLKNEAIAWRTLFDLAGKDLEAFHSFCKSLLSKVNSTNQVNEDLVKWSEEANNRLLGGLHSHAKIEQGEVVLLSSLGGSRGAISVLSVERPNQPGKRQKSAALSFEKSDVTDESKKFAHPYGPVLTRQQATHLLETMKAELKHWPDSDGVSNKAQTVEEFGDIFTRTVNSSSIGEREKEELMHVLSEIMHRLRNTLVMIRWAHVVTMNVMMGISSVCSSSKFSHDMDDKFGK